MRKIVRCRLPAKDSISCDLASTEIVLFLNKDKYLSNPISMHANNNKNNELLNACEIGDNELVTIGDKFEANRNSPDFEMSVCRVKSDIPSSHFTQFI